MTVSQRTDAPFRAQRWVELYNAGVDTIPPFGVCEIVSPGSERPEQGSEYSPGDGRTVLYVTKPTKSNACATVINGPCEIPVGKYARVGTMDDPMLAKVLSASYTTGTVVGPQAGSYYLQEGKCGYLIIGDYDATTETMRVKRWEDCPSEMMVKAIDCITPGSVTGTAQPQQWNASTKCWEDADASPVTICDNNRWLLALPDECFKVERLNSCDSGSGSDTCYRPSFPFGLTRMVKVKKSVNTIGCGMCGTATVLKRVPAGTGGAGSRCDMEESDCTIQVCNMSYRKIACDADEYAMAQVFPGPCCMGSGEGEECVAVLIPYPRPTMGEAKATDKVCGANSTMADFKPTDACDDWPFDPVPETFLNPLGLYVCNGGDMRLQFNEAECQWDLLNVQHYFIDPVVLDIGCKTGGCEIEGTKTMKGIAIQQCEMCGVTEKKSLITGTYMNVVEDVDFDCSSSCEPGSVSYKRICVLCGTDDDNTPSDKPIPVATVTVLTGLGPFSTEDTNGLVLTCGIQATKRSICIVGCLGDVASPDTISFDKIEPLTDADFDCVPCPSLTVFTSACFVLCASSSEDVWDVGSCECDPCEEPSA